MVTAELILVSGGCSFPFEMSLIAGFFFIMYMVAMILLTIRIEQSINLEEENGKLEKENKKLKNKLKREEK